MTFTECQQTLEFRSLLAAWNRDRRCPLPLVDFLLECGLEGEAECARWAATERDRPVFKPMKEHEERGGYCGPYPGCYWKNWRFIYNDNLEHDTYHGNVFAHCIPKVVAEKVLALYREQQCSIAEIQGDSPSEAISDLLSVYGLCWREGLL